MDERSETYLLILEYGLQNIRDAAIEGKVELCRIESDHLHNIPSLIWPTKVERHQYYYEKERTLYIERLKAVVGGENTFAFARYQDLWPVLERCLAEQRDG